MGIPQEIRATSESDHKPPHLNFGPCPKHFLESNSSNSDFYQFVDQFYGNFMGNDDGEVSTGMYAHKPETISIKREGEENSYTLSLKRNGQEVRRLDISKEGVLATSSTIDKPEDLDSSRATFIFTVALRSAGVLTMDNDKLPRH
ncbi:MAG: hypothetical protein AAB531_00025 [Patescibacteria group bacterium]